MQRKGRSPGASEAALGINPGEKKVAGPRWEHRGGEKCVESGNLVMRVTRIRRGLGRGEEECGAESRAGAQLLEGGAWP